MTKTIIEVFKSDKEHIITAREMAVSIYKQKNVVQVEMLTEIKDYLKRLHQNEIKQIDNI